MHVDEEGFKIDVGRKYIFTCSDGEDRFGTVEWRFGEEVGNNGYWFVERQGYWGAILHEEKLSFVNLDQAPRVKQCKNLTRRDKR